MVGMVWFLYLWVGADELGILCVVGLMVFCGGWLVGLVLVVFWVGFGSLGMLYSGGVFRSCVGFMWWVWTTGCLRGLLVEYFVLFVFGMFLGLQLLVVFVLLRVLWAICYLGECLSLFLRCFVGLEFGLSGV